MSERNSIRAQQLQSDWEIGGNLHDMLTEALDSEYKRGADNERERLFSASNGLFMGKPFSYWVELEAQRKRYYGLAEPDWMTPGFKAKIRDAFVCEPTEPVLKSEWEQAQAKIAELENVVEFKNEHIERLIAENLKLHSKPAPQFDAEKVRELIIEYGKYHTACANTKSFVVDDCATMQTVYHNLLTALGIERE